MMLQENVLIRYQECFEVHIREDLGLDKRQKWED